MQRDLCDLVSRRFYSGLLTSADRVTDQSHSLPPALTALGRTHSAPLAFHDVTSGESRRPDGRSWANAAEARVCARLAGDIVRTTSLSVGVVAPYRAQLAELKRARVAVLDFPFPTDTPGEWCDTEDHPDDLARIEKTLEAIDDLDVRESMRRMMQVAARRERYKANEEE